MGEVVANSATFIAGLERYERQFERMFRTRVRMLVSEGMRRMLARTPVHTGQAVMNYVASAGAPASGAVTKGFKPVEATNALPLGAERLRRRAEAVALATLSGVDYSDPFQEFYISNNAPHIAGLEYGALPSEPYTPRSPSGMFRITNQELLMLLASGKL